MTAHKLEDVAHRNAGGNHGSSHGIDVVDLLKSDRSRPNATAQALDHPVPPAPIPNVPLDIRPQIGPDNVEGRTPNTPHPSKGQPRETTSPPIHDKSPAVLKEIPLPPERPKDLGHPPKPAVPRISNSAYDVIDPKPIDPNKKTVVVLDEFNLPKPVPDPKNPGVLITNGNIVLKDKDAYIAHGEMISQVQEQHGHQVVRLEAKLTDRNGTDFSKQLRQFYSDVVSGKLPIPPGSYLNMSLAQNKKGLMGEPTYGEANQFLHTKDNITPYSVNDPKEQAEIFAAMRAKLSDPKVSTQMKDRLQQVLDTNSMITKIQKDLGIKVIVAGGNQGPSHFQWDFLAAHDRLGALGADGNRAPFSAIGSKDLRGDFTLTYSNPSLFDPRPMAQLQPGYTVEGTKGVFLPAWKYGGMLDARKPAEALADPDFYFSKAQMIPHKDASVEPPLTSGKLVPAPKGHPRIRTSEVDVLSKDETTKRLQELEQRTKIRDFAGTSFSNFNYPF